MIRLALDMTLQDNHVFFCPMARVHIARRTGGFGVVRFVTPSIMRALKGHTLIDLDGIIDTNLSVEENNRLLASGIIPTRRHLQKEEVAEKEVVAKEPAKPAKKTTKKETKKEVVEDAK